MTLNQVINRIKGVALSHLQIRNFYRGLPTDFLTDKTTRYASIFLMDLPSGFDTAGKVQNFSFKIFALDLVNVAADAKANEQDVQSDMVEILKDMIATLDFEEKFPDWRVQSSVPFEILYEQFDDLIAGASIDITLSTMWNQDVCAVPSELPIKTEDMKLVFDYVYKATGTEGSSVLAPLDIVGKKIIFLTRENSPMYKVNTNPDTTEFTWNGEVIGLNNLVPLLAGERLLILYREY